MKIAFITSEHPADSTDEFGAFTYNYVRELRKRADVVCVYFHLKKGKPPLPDKTVDYVFSPSKMFDAFTPEACALETAASLRAQVDVVVREFKPDVIHCNGRRTFLPFRFDKNVFYSSHLIFENASDSSDMNDLYFQEMKMERCALEGSMVSAVYSDFAAKSARSLAGGLCSPVVLPLGVDFRNFNSAPYSARNAGDLIVADNAIPRYTSRARKDCSSGKSLRICYFGCIENVRKGVNDFVYAVNRLGVSFKHKYNIEYSIFGSGKIDVGLDISLFDKMECLEGDALCTAYKKADIVVMPSRYESFGLTGLEAMAAGSLVLLPKGLGMDMYAIPGWNCLEIPHYIEGIARAIKDAVLNFTTYQVIRDNAIRTALKWSWERSVASHLYMYRLMKKGRIGEMYSAYNMHEREIVNAFNSSSEMEKRSCAAREKIASSHAIDFIRLESPDCKILVLTGAYVPADGNETAHVQFFSVLNEGKYGLVVRPECLPFDNGEFDIVIVSGAWETVLNPFDAILEMRRVCTDRTVVLYNRGRAYKWQTFQMEGMDDWSTIASKDFNIEMDSELARCISRIVPYTAVVFHKD